MPLFGDSDTPYSDYLENGRVLPSTSGSRSRKIDHYEAAWDRIQTAGEPDGADQRGPVGYGQFTKAEPSRSEVRRTRVPSKSRSISTMIVPESGTKSSAKAIAARAARSAGPNRGPGIIASEDVLNEKEIAQLTVNHKSATDAPRNPEATEEVMPSIDGSIDAGIEAAGDMLERLERLQIGVDVPSADPSLGARATYRVQVVSRWFNRRTVISRNGVDVAEIIDAVRQNGVTALDRLLAIVAEAPLVQATQQRYSEVTVHKIRQARAVGQDGVAE